MEKAKAEKAKKLLETIDTLSEITLNIPYHRSYSFFLDFHMGSDHIRTYTIPSRLNDKFLKLIEEEKKAAIAELEKL